MLYIWSTSLVNQFRKLYFYEQGLLILQLHDPIVDLHIM